MASWTGDADGEVERRGIDRAEGRGTRRLQHKDDVNVTGGGRGGSSRSKKNHEREREQGTERSVEYM